VKEIDLKEQKQRQGKIAFKYFDLSAGLFDIQARHMPGINSALLDFSRARFDLIYY